VADTASSSRSCLFTLESRPPRLKIRDGRRYAAAASAVVLQVSRCLRRATAVRSTLRAICERSGFEVRESAGRRVDTPAPMLIAARSAEAVACQARHAGRYYRFSSLR